MSFSLMIIGAAGMAGAIETGSGMVPSIIIFAIGATWTYIAAKKGEAKVKKHISNGNINCHDYPAGLGTLKRRA